ncbi:hypothetical protein F5146DRAFT_1002267 [Armillaria mellea]|nr:hypothetical protein F5146DRAFT_1002267 [Armillaria mellea]
MTDLYSVDSHTNYVQMAGPRCEKGCNSVVVYNHWEVSQPSAPLQKSQILFIRLLPKPPDVGGIGPILAAALFSNQTSSRKDFNSKRLDNDFRAQLPDYSSAKQTNMDCPAELDAPINFTPANMDWDVSIMFTAQDGESLASSHDADTLFASNSQTLISAASEDSTDPAPFKPLSAIIILEFIEASQHLFSARSPIKKFFLPANVSNKLNDMSQMDFSQSTSIAPYNQAGVDKTSNLLTLGMMLGSIFSVITRTPLTGWDAPPTPPETKSTDSYDGAALICVRASGDALVDVQQSEGVYSTTDATLSLAEMVTGAEVADVVEQPRFSGDYDLFTMDCPLREICMAPRDESEPDHKVLHQAMGCAILRKGLWENGSAVFADIHDPTSCTTIPLHLTLVAEIDIIYTEEELDFFIDLNHHLRTNVPGVFANLEFENGPDCLLEERFLMNWCWARTEADGSVAELFEGYMEFKIDNGMHFLGRCGEDINLVQHAFWAICHLPVDEVVLNSLNDTEGTFDYSFLL